jgi:hypothetical protein
VLPWIGEGLAATGRSRGDIQVSTSVFAVVGAGAARDALRAETRRQIAFYASTPSYAPVLAQHGWTAQGEELGRLAARGRWDDMAAVIDDTMLAEFAVEGDTLADVARAIRARYAGLLDRVAVYQPFIPGDREDEWAAAAAVFAAPT